MMCEIAEGERKRLYYESQTEKAVSQSQSTSPLKGKLETSTLLARLISEYDRGHRYSPESRFQGNSGR